MDLPLTVVNQVREGEEVREVSYEEALRARNEGASSEAHEVMSSIERLRQRGRHERHR